jgi:3-methyladenine DNA glycosylase AlkD
MALGIDTPTLRGYCREEVMRLKPVWPISDAIALCDRLLQEEELEVRGAGFLILGAFKKEFSPDLIPWAKRWLDTRLDNWALVDGFCGTVLSPLLDAHPSVEAALKQWSRDRLLWVRRAALVTLVPFARRGRLLETVYALAQEHFADPEDLMHKATGWLLRETGKTDMPRLRAFLRAHGPAIPRTALRYAIERFPASERRRLLKLTRAAPA